MSQRRSRRNRPGDIRPIWACPARRKLDRPLPALGPNVARLSRAMKLLACDALIDANEIDAAQHVWNLVAVEHLIECGTRTTHDPTEGSLSTTEAHAPPPDPLGDAD